MKKLKCIQTVTTPFKFTKGKYYWFTESIDPEGWSTVDDDGNKEVFYDTRLLFK